MGRNKEFKCIYYGKYISYKDLGNGNIGHNYIPDTEYTVESNEFWHIKCKKQKRYEHTK